MVIWDRVLTFRNSRRAGSRFLIDGFPRSLENYEGWCSVVGAAATVVGCLFFECGDAELERRLLQRGLSSGRDDDNREVCVSVCICVRVCVCARMRVKPNLDHTHKP